MPNLNFFRTIHTVDPNFFDEGPTVKQTIAMSVNTSSIATSMIDGFRQGVEITQLKYYDAGIYKIYSGEPGHVLFQGEYGETQPQDNIIFVEKDNFNPVQYLKAQEFFDPWLNSVITFPIIIGDETQDQSDSLNGAIEPLTIRAVAAFSSIDTPFEAHSIKGNVMSGNPDKHSADDLVLTVDTFDPNPNVIGYLDFVDIFEGQPLDGVYSFEQVERKPFIDVRTDLELAVEADLKALELPNNDSVAYAALMLSGSRDNGYISQDQRSATSGWEYDRNARIGTDSLAFGGMAY